jgi:hypothetical protein
VNQLSIYAYPWDIAWDGVDSTVAFIRRLGCNRMAVAVVYHSAEVIAPRRSERTQVAAEPNVAHLAIPAHFSDLALGHGTLATAHAALASDLGRSAQRQGIGLTAWTVVMHNSTLARNRPDCALRNCFGDFSTHALCPANAAARRYAVELCQAVLSLEVFDELFVESVAYLLAGHGHPHELWAVRNDPASRYLLSLCFCDACLEEGRRRGIDGVALKDWTSRELRRTWNSGLSLLRDPDCGDELAGYLLSRPDLFAWSQMRCDVVADLVGDISEVARHYQARLSAGLGVWARPAPLGWMEGVEPRRLAQVADSLVAMPYYVSTGAVTRDLDHYLGSVEAHKLHLAQTLWPAHHSSSEVLLAKVRAAYEAGVSSFSLYNLVTAPDPVLPWVNEVADLLGTSV